MAKACCAALALVLEDLLSSKRQTTISAPKKHVALLTPSVHKAPRAWGWDGDGTFSPADATDLLEMSFCKSRCKL